MIDINKQYKTRDGREVKVYAVDGGGSEPVHGAIKVGINRWDIFKWHADGSYLAKSGSDADLVEVKPRIQISCWINVYPEGGLSISHKTKELADAVGSTNRLACVEIKIDCEEGEGLK